jgi:hypothetical protein
VLIIYVIDFEFCKLITDPCISADIGVYEVLEGGINPKVGRIDVL